MRERGNRRPGVGQVLERGGAHLEQPLGDAALQVEVQQIVGEGLVLLDLPREGGQELAGGLRLARDELDEVLAGGGPDVGVVQREQVGAAGEVPSTPSSPRNCGVSTDACRIRRPVGEKELISIRPSTRK